MKKVWDNVQASFLLLFSITIQHATSEYKTKRITCNIEWLNNINNDVSKKHRQPLCVEKNKYVMATCNHNYSTSTDTCARANIHDIENVSIKSISFSNFETTYTHRECHTHTHTNKGVNSSKQLVTNRQYTRTTYFFYIHIHIHIHVHSFIIHSC